MLISMVHLQGSEDSLNSMVTPAELFSLQEENAQLRKEVETAQAKLRTHSDECRTVNDVCVLYCSL